MVYRIAFIGAPCGGKTTILRRLVEPIRLLGFATYPVPEVASLLISAGARTQETAGQRMLQFQRGTIRVQRAVEDSIVEIATSENGPAVVLYDRCILDVAGFLETAAWHAVVRDIGLDPSTLLQRYDLVLQLDSVAGRGPDVYTNAHDVRRFESVDEAELVESRLRTAWGGNPRVKVVSFRDDFEEKIGDAVTLVTAFLSSMKPAHQ